MNDSTAVLLLVALLVVCAFAWLIYRQRRSEALRGRFGPEYDRLVTDHGNRGRAEAELDQRMKRIDHLPIRPLSPERRSRYAEMWDDQQSRFVDEPEVAVSQADHLVEQVMRERGYPIAEFDQRAADVSVDHPGVVENYRAAHQIVKRHRTGESTTEDLRRAMIYYRDLFQELLQDGPMPGRVHSR